MVRLMLPSLAVVSQMQNRDRKQSRQRTSVLDTAKRTGYTGFPYFPVAASSFPPRSVAHFLPTTKSYRHSHYGVLH
ncbi:aldo/keto reductase [Anopheles sinensis]|uniref:Aldo/keto reductase n=1 Tax=Anopheles sinensis TaxID=74873 RepID=A0A084VT92_ANOSI|nr:aldo/keto reductase [Anopheles sinensis]